MTTALAAIMVMTAWGHLAELNQDLHIDGLSDSWSTENMTIDAHPCLNPLSCEDMQADCEEVYKRNQSSSQQPAPAHQPCEWAFPEADPSGLISPLNDWDICQHLEHNLARNPESEPLI